MKLLDIFKKNILLFLVPIGIITGITIPLTARAGWLGCAGGAAVGGIVAILTWWVGGAGIVAGVAITASACAIGSLTQATLDSVLGTAGTQLFKAIILAICTLLTYITDTIASFAAGWVKTLVSTEYLTSPITDLTPLVVGWTQVRDLANMFIVLGFVIVGIAFTLRIEGYGTKKILFNVIIIAILVNFSGIFCGIIIDTSHMLTLHFLKSGGEVGTTILGNFESAYNMPPEKGGIDWQALAKKDDGLASYISAIVFFPIAYILIAVVFFYLVIILVAQRAIFCILYVLSPIAFACWIFPDTKKLWHMWWDNFLKWGLLVAQVAFFLWLASKMIVPGQDASQTNFTTYLSILIMLFVAIKVAKNSSAAGSGAIMGLVSNGVKVARGGAILGASTVAGAAGLKGLAQRAGQGVKDRATSAGEKMGVVAKGTTSINKQNRLKEPTDRLEKGFANDSAGNESLAKIAQQRAVTSQQRTDKAAAAQILAKRNAFDKIDPRNRETVAKFSQSMGATKDTFAKVGSGVGISSTKKEVLAEARTGETIKDTKKRLETKKSIEQSLGLSETTDTDVFNNIVSKKQQEYVNLGHTWEDARNMTKEYKQSEMTDQIRKEKDGFVQERIAGAIKKMSPSKAAELSDETVNSSTLGSFSEKQLDEVLKKGAPKLIEKFTKYKDKTSHEYAELRDKIISLENGSKEKKELIKAYLTIKSKF